MKTTVKIVMLLIIVMVTGSCTIFNGFGIKNGIKKVRSIDRYGKVKVKKYRVFTVIGEDKNSSSFANIDAQEEAHRVLSLEIKPYIETAAFEISSKFGKERSAVLIDILERKTKVSFEGLRPIEKYPKAPKFNRKCNCFRVKLLMGIESSKYAKSIRTSAIQTITESRENLKLSKEQYALLMDDFVARALELGRKNQEEIY